MQNTAQRASADFETFYKTHFKQVYRLCFSYLRNEADAEDITADVFVKVLKGDITFKDADHEKKWLTVAAINACKSLLRTKWKRNVGSIDDLPEIAAADGDPDSELREAILNLPVKYREVITLYYYEGYGTDEIAKMLKRPAATVRWQLTEARKKLKNILGGNEL